MTTMTEDYLSEEVMFGGEICTRGHMINELRKIAPNERCVDMFLIGHALATRIRAHKEAKTRNE